MRLNDLDKTSIKYYLSEDLKKDSSLNEHWDRIDNEFFKPWQKYLNEATLTPDQINQMFAAAEKETSAGGGNSSLLGKIVDKVIPSAFLSKLEKSLPEPDPNAQPDPEFEAKATAAVQQLQAPAETKTGLMAIVKAAVKNPQVQAMVLSLVGGVLGGLVQAASPLIQGIFPGGGTAVVAITGAIVAGGVAIAAAKLQGKGWKEAFKGAIKPALAGAAGAVIGSMAAQFVGGAVNMAADAVKGAGAKSATGGGLDPNDPDVAELNRDKADMKGAASGATGTVDPGITDNPLSSPTLNKLAAKVAAGEILTDKEMGYLDKIERSAVQMTTMANPEGTSGIGSPDSQITLNSGEVVSGREAAQLTTGHYDSVHRLKMQAVELQGNAKYGTPKMPGDDYYTQSRAGDFSKVPNTPNDGSTRVIGKQPKFDSVIRTGKKLSEGQVYLVFNRIVTRNNYLLVEGRLAEGPMDWLKTKAKNLTTKVTADKLNSAWQKAGSPTDSEQLKKFLTDQGVATEVVDKVYTTLKLPAAGTDPAAAPGADPAAAPGADPAAAALDPKQAETLYAKVKKEIVTLDKKSQKQMAAYLQKQLGTA